MLSYLRENTGNWIIKIFLGIIVIVFVFLGVGSIGSKRNSTVATINDEPITISEFQQAYKNQIQQLQAQFGKNLNEELIKAFNLKQAVLDGLVEQRLLLAEAEKLELKVSDREIQDLLLSIKAFQKDGIFDIELYKKVLGRNSLNPEIFEENQILALKQDKIRKMIRSTVTVSDLEAKEFYLYQNTKMAIDYLAFDPETYTDIKPSDDQINAFYDANKESYKSEKLLKAAFIQFSSNDYKDEVNITDEAAKNYYEENIKEFEAPEKVEARHILIRLDENADELSVAEAEKKAEDIYKKAIDGKDFETLAKDFSDGPSKTSGGYLGTFEHKSMVKPFADAAFSMQAGDISKPVRTQFGLHIIKVLARVDASTQTFEQASEKIKAQLTKDNLNYIAYDRAGEAFDAVIDGDDFDQVAMIADKKIVNTNAFDISGKGLAFPNAAQFAQAAFALTNEDISDVKQFGDSYYLIKIVERIEPVVQPLDMVKEQLTKDVLLKLQNEKALADANMFLEKAKQSGALDQLALPGKMKIETTPLFTRNGQIEGLSDSSKIVQAGFGLSKDNKLFPEIVNTNNLFYLISFKEIKTPEENEISENLKTTKNELTWRKQSQSYQNWISQLKKQYTIRYNPELLN